MINLKNEHLVKDHEHGYMIVGNKADLNSHFVFERETFLAEPVYNRQLKQIALKMGIHKEVRDN